MKKSGRMTIGTLGLYVLLAFTVVILVYIFVIQEGGGFQKITESVSKLRKYLPGDDLIGAEEIEATPTTIPEHHVTAIESLKNAIEATLQVDKKDCFTEYGELPNLGHRQTSIEFKYDNGKTTMFVYGGVDGRKLIPELTTEFEGMIPCVIAGSNSVTENFFNKFIDKDEEVSSGYFNPTNYVKIFYSDKKLGSQIGRVLDCDGGNRIMTIPLTIDNWYYDQGPNYYCNNLDDGGRFFSPDNKQICFMPTNYIENNDQHGIDNDYISGSENNGIPKRLERGELKQC